MKESTPVGTPPSRLPYSCKWMTAHAHYAKATALVGDDHTSCRPPGASWQSLRLRSLMATGAGERSPVTSKVSFYRQHSTPNFAAQRVSDPQPCLTDSTPWSDIQNHREKVPKPNIRPIRRVEMKSDVSGCLRGNNSIEVIRQSMHLV